MERPARILCLSVLLLSSAGYGAYCLSARAFRDHLQVGRDAVRGGDWAAAEAAAARLKRAGKPQDAQLLLGHVWAARARAADGREQADACRHALLHLTQVRSTPLVTEAAVVAAECLVRLGELRLAEEALATVVRQKPDEPDAHRWLAAVYVELNSPVKAAHHLTEWGRLDPSSGWPLRWAGFFHKTVEKPAAAVGAYRAALARPLDDAVRADAARELAEVLLRLMEDHEGALAALAQAPEPARGRPEFQALRAEAAWGLGRHAEAAALVDEALRAAPDSAPLLRLRGRFYLHRDDPRAARPLLERAATLAPHDPGTLKDLADACEQSGDKAAADGCRRTFDRTTALRARMTQLYLEAERRPWDPAPRRDAARVCEELQRPDEARMWAKAARACAPADATGRESLGAVAVPK